MSLSEAVVTSVVIISLAVLASLGIYLIYAYENDALHLCAKSCPSGFVMTNNTSQCICVTEGAPR